MECTDVAGLSIAYDRAGAGPAVVLLHGAFGFDRRSWRRQLDSLSNDFTVVACDAPGAGDSDDPPSTFGLPDYADCVAGFIAALGLDRPHVLGLSFGGGLALQLHDRHPAAARSLVLTGAYAGWAGSLSADVLAARLQQAERETAIPPDQWLPSYVPGMVSPGAPTDVVEQVHELMRDIRPGGHLMMLRAMAAADLRAALPRVSIPTLVLHGERDEGSPIRIAEELHASIPVSKLVWASRSCRRCLRRDAEEAGRALWDEHPGARLGATPARSCNTGWPSRRRRPGGGGGKAPFLE